MSTVNDGITSAAPTEEKRKLFKTKSNANILNLVEKFGGGTESDTIGREKMKLHFCVYRKEVRDYVFLPHGYGKRYYSQHKHSNPPFCKKCRLQPCLNAEYASEIYGEGHRIATYMDTNCKEAHMGEGQALRNDKITYKLCRRVRKIMEDLYGKEYADKKGIPRCVWDTIHNTFPGSDYFSGNSEEETDTDSDNENSNPDIMFNPKYFEVRKRKR